MSKSQILWALFRLEICLSPIDFSANTQSLLILVIKSCVNMATVAQITQIFYGWTFLCSDKSLTIQSFMSSRVIFSLAPSRRFW
jgi:hypothetical protein